MTISLWQRIANAFTTGGASLTEQDLLRQAMASRPDITDASQLPETARLLLAELETRSRYGTTAGS